VFSDAWREIVRKANRLGLRRALTANLRQRAQALTRLGETAWREQIDLTGAAELRSHLQQFDVRARDLSAAAARRGAEQGELESRRAAVVARFDAQLAAARATQADAARVLGAARAALTERDGAIRALETRLAHLASQVESPGDPPPSSGAAARPREIEVEHRSLADQVAVETAARPRLAADVGAADAESQRCAAETRRIEQERATELRSIDAELDRIRAASNAATRESASLSREQADRYRELGAMLYDERRPDAVLQDAVQAVVTLDASREATQAAIDKSLILTRAMPPWTMAKFLVVVVLVAVALAWTALRVRARYSSTPSSAAAPQSAPTTSPARQRAAADAVAADERRKDEAVMAFTGRATDPVRRSAAVEVLAADIRALGSSADRSVLPMLLAVLARGEPELRAAAAQALGMMKPTSAEVPALVTALNDSIPAVRNAVVQALGEAPDASARLLVQRVLAGTRDRASSADGALTPTVPPDAARLRVAIYPGATFLAFASDLEGGRVSYSSVDPVQQVIDFYAAASSDHRSVSGEEFTRLYFGGSPEDPTGAKAIGAETEAWVRSAVASRTADAEIQAEAERRAARMLNLPLIRYAEAAIYGSPAFIALEVARTSASARAPRYVVVFKDNSLARTGFEIHLGNSVSR
jgi:hypothetical protein